MGDDGDGKLKTLRFGILVLGLLVFMGSGCMHRFESHQSQNPDEKWEESIRNGALSGIRFSDLVFHTVGERSYVKGVEVVCDLDNAKVLFAKDEDWSAIDHVLDQKKKEGWHIEHFCYTSGTAFVVLGSDTNRQDDVVRSRFMMGMLTEPISFSDSFIVDESGSFMTDGWRMSWIDHQVIASVAGENLAYSWRATIVFDPASHIVKQTAICAESRNELPSGVKANVMEDCQHTFESHQN